MSQIGISCSLSFSLGKVTPKTRGAPFCCSLAAGVVPSGTSFRMKVSYSAGESMQHPMSSRIRQKHARGRAIRAADTTVFPIAMVVVLTAVLVLLMVLAAQR